MPILLKDIWPIENLADYKIHFARYNQHSQPLEVWVRSKEEWQSWQEYRPVHNQFEYKISDHKPRRLLKNTLATLWAVYQLTLYCHQTAFLAIVKLCFDKLA